MSVRPSDDSRSFPLAAAIAIGLFVCVAIYLGIFGALWLDEVVLETRIVLNHSPEWLTDLFRIIYWPLLKLLGFID
jgi:hypothetical protein